MTEEGADRPDVILHFLSECQRVWRLVRTARAYVVGSREEATFLQLRALLGPCGITRDSTGMAGVDRRSLPPEQHTVGTLSLQKMER